MKCMGFRANLQWKIRKFCCEAICVFSYLLQHYNSTLYSYVHNHHILSTKYSADIQSLLDCTEKKLTSTRLSSSGLHVNN